MIPCQGCDYLFEALPHGRGHSVIRCGLKADRSSGWGDSKPPPHDALHLDLKVISYFDNVNVESGRSFAAWLRRSDTAHQHGCGIASQGAYSACEEATD